MPADLLPEPGPRLVLKCLATLRCPSPGVRRAVERSGRAWRDCVFFPVDVGWIGGMHRGEVDVYRRATVRVDEGGSGKPFSAGWEIGDQVAASLYPGEPALWDDVLPGAPLGLVTAPCGPDREVELLLSVEVQEVIWEELNPRFVHVVSREGPEGHPQEERWWVEVEGTELLGVVRRDDAWTFQRSSRQWLPRSAAPPAEAPGVSRAGVASVIDREAFLRAFDHAWTNGAETTTGQPSTRPAGSLHHRWPTRSTCLGVFSHGPAAPELVNAGVAWPPDAETWEQVSTALDLRYTLIDTLDAWGWNICGVMVHHDDVPTFDYLAEHLCATSPPVMVVDLGRHGANSLRALRLLKRAKLTGICPLITVGGANDVRLEARQLWPGAIATTSAGLLETLDPFRIR